MQPSRRPPSFSARTFAAFAVAGSLIATGPPALAAVPLANAIENAEEKLRASEGDAGPAAAAEAVAELRASLAEAGRATLPVDVRRARYLLAYALLADDRPEAAAVVAEAVADLWAEERPVPPPDEAEAEDEPSTVGTIEDRAAATVLAVRAYLTAGLPTHLARATALAERLAALAPDGEQTADVLLAVARALAGGDDPLGAARLCDLVPDEAERAGDARLAAGRAYAAAAKAGDAGESDRFATRAADRLRAALADWDFVGSVRVGSEVLLADMLAETGDVAGAVATLGAVDLDELPDDSPLRETVRLRPLRIATEAGEIASLPAAVVAAVEAADGTEVSDRLGVAILDALDRAAGAGDAVEPAAFDDAVRATVDGLLSGADGRRWLLAGLAKHVTATAERSEELDDLARALAVDEALLEAAESELAEADADALRLRIVTRRRETGATEEAASLLAELLGRHAGELAFEAEAARLVDLRGDGDAVRGGTFVPDGPSFVGWVELNRQASALLRAGRFEDEAAFDRVAALRDESRLRIVEATRAESLAEYDPVARHAGLARAVRLAEAFAGEGEPANGFVAAIAALLPELRADAEATRQAAAEFAGGPTDTSEAEPPASNPWPVVLAVAAALAGIGGGAWLFRSGGGRRRSARYEPPEEELFLGGGS